MKRARRIAAWLVLCALLLAACGGSSSGSSTTAAAPGASSTTSGGGSEQPKTGGTLVAPVNTNPQHLIRSRSSDVAIAMIGLPMQESLIRVSRDYEIIPVLAESWDVSEDGLLYTFHLRKGVKWHDGEDFTAEDVKFSFDEILPLAPTGSALLNVIKETRIVDDHTVEVELSVPFAPFLLSLNPMDITILPEHVYAGTDILSNPANHAPVGTGPFKFEEWVPGERVVLVRNEGYWDEGKPYLDRLIFPIIPDDATRVSAFYNGEVDYLNTTYLPSTEISKVEGDDRFVLAVSGNQSSLGVMHFNLERPPLANADVRKALFQAIDRNLIVEAAFAGYADPGVSSMPATVAWAYNPDIDYMEMYPYDPEAAEALLDQAGFPREANGVRFNLEFKYRPDLDGYDAIADILRAQWGAIGVEVEIAPRERAVWIEEVYANHDYDVTMVGLAARLDPLLGVQRAYVCETRPDATFTNPTSYCNEELDALFQEGASTPKYEDRAPFYHQAQEIIARDLPSAVIVDTPSFDAIWNEFEGLDEFFDSALGSAPNWAFIRQR